MRKPKKHNAFSLIELSIAIMIIGILIASIISALSLVKKSRVKNAMRLTQSSHIADISDLEVWLETSDTGAVKGELDDGDNISGWIGRASVSDSKSGAISDGNDPAFCRWCVGGLPGIKFSSDTYFILPKKLKSVFKKDFVMYIVELPGSQRGKFITVEGDKDNNLTIGYEDNVTMRFFDQTTFAKDMQGTRIHMFMVSGGNKYYAMNGSHVKELSSNTLQIPVFRFAQNKKESFSNSDLSRLISNVAAVNGDYILGKTDTAIAEIIIASGSNENSLNDHSKTIESYLYKKYEVILQNLTDSDGDGVPDDEDECPSESGLLQDKGCPV